MHFCRLAKKNSAYLQQISEKYTPGENFIFYPIHLEPEANIIARTILDSQLAIISMLSQSLPKGWYLYVKEHPLQNAYESPGFEGKIINNDCYRSKEFYDIIKKMPKVRLIDKGEFSKTLIEASRAVVTMSGTAAWEAVHARKPVMLFAHRTPVRFLEEAFHITSAEECRQALQKIVAGFVPEYADFENVVNRFVVSKDAQGYKTLVRSMAAQMSQ